MIHESRSKQQAPPYLLPSSVMQLLLLLLIYQVHVYFYTKKSATRKKKTAVRFLYEVIGYVETRHFAKLCVILRFSCTLMSGTGFL